MRQLHLARVGCLPASLTRTLPEIEALRATGRSLARGLEVFAECARVGDSVASVIARVREAIGEPAGESVAELVVHGHPANQKAPDQTHFSKSDVLTLHLAGRGALGLWYELSGLYAFERLSETADRMLHAVELTYQAAMLRMASGHNASELRETLDAVLTTTGIGNVGGGSIACYPISDRGPRAEGNTDSLAFQSNMVVVFRPSPAAPNDPEFQIAETMLVRPDGAVPMSPRGSIFRRISG